MSTHANMVKMTTATTGTGPITLGSASSGFQSFADAYGANATVDVLITDGTAWEVARNCTYTHSGTTLTRGTLEDSSTGAALTLTGSAVVSVVATAELGNALERQIQRGFVYVRNDNSATTSCTNGGFTKISAALATEVVDSQGWWDATNKKFLPLRAGKFFISCAVGVDNVGAGKTFILSLYKNGSEYLRLSRQSNATTGDYPQLNGAAIVELNGSTDYAEVYLYNGDTTSKSTSALDEVVWFTACWLET